MKSLWTTMFTAALVSGCASINSLSLTPIPADRKVIILGFNFDNDFVDGMVDDLRRQCPNVKVTGILTKDENINYFLYLVWKKQVTATGYCVTTGTAKADKPKARGTASDEPQAAPEAEAEL